MPQPHPRASLLTLALVLLIAGDAYGQGFAAITGRNHPEIRWRVAETQHFRIMYPAHLEGIENEAAPIAEQTYRALSANLGVTFPERIRIYLSDEDEITNGFASRLGDGWSSIWVHAGQPDAWTGPESWLRRVLAHEIAHLFHYRAVRSNIGLFDLLFADPLPRFWTEGLAQYQTERWDAYRGEIWLRTAVLEDRLSYRDGRSATNGRLLYAVGNSQVRFLASTYGDSTLTRMLHHRRAALLGLARVHDFRQAFRAATGESYDTFYDRWRRHVNIQYNTFAGQQQSIDSLDAQRLQYPGQYLYDVRALPDGRRLLLSLESVERPVRRLALVDSSRGRTVVLAEGVIQAPVSSTPDGRWVAYSRRGRARHGSLLFDVYLVDTTTGTRRRLTHGARAASPALSPDGTRIAYVVNERGASSIRLLDLRTDRLERIPTDGEAYQISDLRWHPRDDRIAYYVFSADGRRRIEVLDLATSARTRVTSGRYDDRRPVWSPDGASIAFTSLRDEVPNIFVTDLDGSERRVTNLATGATVSDWVKAPEDSSNGRMLAIVSRSKETDLLYSVDASERAAERDVRIDSAFVAWTSHRPPATIAARIAPDPSLVQKRYPYSTWRNISHVASIGLPYFNSTGDWGIGGGTLWLEPLGKHVLGAAAGLSIADLDKSFAWITYINNQLRPSVALTLYHLPDVALPYGDSVLREDFSSASLDALVPLDWRPRPYTSTRVLFTARYYRVKPLNALEFSDSPDGLPVPAAGRQASIRISIRRKTLRPYRDNQINPLDGWGVRSRLTAAIRDESLSRGYVRFESSAYGIVPLVEKHRLYVHGRYRGQHGTSLPQDFVGLSRYDAIRIDAGGLLQWTSSESDRVRGHRRLVIGRNVLFGSVEYRIPLVASLRTQLLGIVSLGSTVLAPFFDAGYVWARPNDRDAVGQFGAGIEVKNTLRFFGVVDVTQSVGFAQPTDALFSEDRYEIYYRLQSALPF